jgi:putative membrane protein insertion efficiency factor
VGNTDRGEHAWLMTLRAVGRGLAQVPAWVLIGIVYIYRWTLSPLIGRHCRFEPTCSMYFILSVRKHGAIRGAFRGILRVCRCHPWHPGGYDPP